MNNKLSTKGTKLIYWISAFLIAFLTASTYTFTGFASPIARTGAIGSFESGSQVIVKQAPVVVEVVSEGPQTETISLNTTTDSSLEVPVVPAENEVPSPSYDGLANFSNQVTNGNGSQVTGLYSENIFALNVVQQPSGQAGYVATSENSTTQFSMATGLGFLAHNYLAGASFANINYGMIISVVYGDGSTSNYRVTNIRKFQALDPESPYSAFIDLASGEQLTGTDLFNQTYAIPGQIVLQTCISANGNSSWGRLFIIATPEN